MAAESNHPSPGKTANGRATEDAQQVPAGINHVTVAFSRLNGHVSHSSTSVPLLAGP